MPGTIDLYFEVYQAIPSMATPHDAHFIFIFIHLLCGKHAGMRALGPGVWPLIHMVYL